MLDLMQSVAGQRLRLGGHERHAVSNDYKVTVLGADKHIKYERMGPRTNNMVYSHADRSLDVVATLAIFQYGGLASLATSYSPGIVWALTLQFGRSHANVAVQLNMVRENNGDMQLYIVEVALDTIETAADEPRQDARQRSAREAADDGDMRECIRRHREDAKTSKTQLRNKFEAEERREARHVARRDLQTQSLNGDNSYASSFSRRSMPGCPVDVESAIVVLYVDLPLCEFLNGGNCTTQAHFDAAETYAIDIVTQSQLAYHVDVNVHLLINQIVIVTDDLLAWNQCGPTIETRLDTFTEYFLDLGDTSAFAGSMVLTTCHDGETTLGVAFTQALCTSDDFPCCVRFLSRVVVYMSICGHCCTLAFVCGGSRNSSVYHINVFRYFV